MLLLLPAAQQRSRQKVKQPVQKKVPNVVRVDDPRTPMVQVSVATMAEARDAAEEAAVHIAVVSVADLTGAKDQPTLRKSMSTDSTTRTMTLTSKRRTERLPRPLTTFIKGALSAVLLVAIAHADPTQSGAEGEAEIVGTQNGVGVEAIEVDSVAATNVLGRKPGLMNQAKM